MIPLIPLVHIALLLVLPIFIVGVINRVKALWGGRKGPPLDQLFFDVRRLLLKTPVYSETTTPVFVVTPWFSLAALLVAAAFIPLFPGYSLASLPYDVVIVAYLFGLSRVCLILSAMDTGSSFEGMGASREALFSALIEPAFFLAVGTLILATGNASFREVFTQAVPESFAGAGLPWDWIARGALIATLLVVLQVEAARVPVDDPNTHLELTMIHEVMILDHSGPELAAWLYGTSLKMTLIAGLISALLNPFSIQQSPVSAIAFSVASILGVAIFLGLVESLIARLRMRSISRYTLAGFIAAFASLLAILARQGLWS